MEVTQIIQNQSIKNFKIIKLLKMQHIRLAQSNNGKMVGSCQYSDMTVFSFHPVKTITTVVVTTNKKEYYEKLISLRSHGIVR